MNIQEWKTKIIENKEVSAIPIMTYPGLKFTGKTIKDLVTNGENHFKCIQALAYHYPSAAGVMVMDLSVEAEAFGAQISLSNNEVPSIKSRIVWDAESIVALQVPEVGAARTYEYLKAATLAANNCNNKPVFGGIIGPYSLAGRLFDLTEIMMFILMEPDAANILLQKATTFLKEYAMAFKKAGVQGVVIAEPAAGLLSPDLCQEFSSKYVKQIVDYVQDDTFMVILHNCGNTVDLVPSMLSTGSLAFHFGNAVDMKDIMPQIPANRLALGNIDPAGIFKNSTPETIKHATTKLLNDMKEYPNFIISSGCDVPPGTPVENIDTFFETIKNYNSKQISDIKIFKEKIIF